MSLAEKLKTLRLEHNMTQQDVATRISVARSTVAGYEKKERQPSLGTLATLADIFGVTVDYLITDKTANECINIDTSKRVLPSDEATMLLARYQKLSPDSRKLLMDFIQILEKAEQNTQKRQNP